MISIIEYNKMALRHLVLVFILVNIFKTYISHVFSVFYECFGHVIILCYFILSFNALCMQNAEEFGSYSF